MSQVDEYPHLYDMLNSDPCPRKCDGCANADHHWMERVIDPDDPNDEDHPAIAYWRDQVKIDPNTAPLCPVIYRCKHCPAWMPNVNHFDEYPDDEFPDEKFAYFIYVPFTKEGPQCVKIAVKKATAKQVVLAESNQAAGYGTHWKRDNIHWTPLAAWEEYRATIKSESQELSDAYQKLRSELRAADQAIEALAQLSQAQKPTLNAADHRDQQEDRLEAAQESENLQSLKPPGPPDPPPGYPKPRFG